MGAQAVFAALGFQPLLCGVRPLLFVDVDQLRGKVAQLRIELQQEPILLQGTADQKARTADQQGCQPEYCKDLPE